MDFTQADRRFTFTHDGKTWDLPRVNAKEVKLPYARFRQDKRKDFLLGHFDPRMPQEYRVAMEVFQAGADDGTYAWRSEPFYASLQDPENQIRLIWLWFQMVDKKITEQAIADLWWAEVGQEKRPLRDLLYEMLNEKNPSSPQAVGGNGQVKEPSPPSCPAPLSAPEAATKS